MKRYLLLLLCCWALPTLADTLRCGNKLVYEGDPLAKVEARCGQPAQISHSSILKFPTIWHHGRLYQLSDREESVPVETWIYNFGPRQFMRKLRFEDGLLVEIEVLDYGY
jgi:Protein of unknown function (DUF2845)